MSKRPRVMIVDDEERICGSIAALLADEFDVLTFTSGRDALAAIGGGAQFDVILCDVMMPGVSGIDVHRALVNTAPESAERIVFMSGGISNVTSANYLAALPNALVDKPFDQAVLRAALWDTVARTRT